MKKGKCINKVKDKDLAIVKKIKIDNCSDSFKELSSGYDNFYLRHVTPDIMSLIHSLGFDRIATNNINKLLKREKNGEICER